MLPCRVFERDLKRVRDRVRIIKHEPERVGVLERHLYRYRDRVLENDRDLDFFHVLLLNGYRQR